MEEARRLDCEAGVSTRHLISHRRENSTTRTGSSVAGPVYIRPGSLTWLAPVFRI